MQAEKQWEIFIKEDLYSLACVKVIFLTNLNATQLLMFLLLSNLQKFGKSRVFLRMVCQKLISSLNT